MGLFSKRVLFWILCSLTLSGAATDAPTRKERLHLFYDAQNSFARAHNDWEMILRQLSPDSPDFEARVRKQWLDHDITTKFERLVRTLR